MAHLPTTASGRLFALLVIAAGIPLVLWIGVSLSGPVVWIVLALGVVVMMTSLFWRARLDAARERAYDPALGFANVVARMRAENALADANRVEARARRSSTYNG